MLYLAAVLALAQSSASVEIGAAHDCHADTVNDASVLLQSRARINIEPNHDQIANPFEQASNMLSVDSAGDASEVLKKMFQDDPAPRNLTKVHDVKKIVEDILMPGLQGVHDYAESQLTSAKTAIDACNSDADARLMNETQMRNVSVEFSEQNHASCRLSQQELDDIMDTDCGHLEEFLRSLDFSNLPATKDLEDVFLFLEKMNDYYEELESQNESCSTATEAHDTKDEECLVLQTVFEGHFCEYRRELVDLNGMVDTCYNTHKEHHDRLKHGTEALVPGWKAEYKGIQKITCYLDTWLSDNNATTINKTVPPDCKAQTIDTSPMDVDYPEIPGKLLVDLLPVEEYPGTQGFFARYNGLIHKEEVVSCIHGSTTPIPGSTAHGPMTPISGS